MIVDGKQIAKDIKLSLKRIIKKKRLKLCVAVVYVGDDPVINSFVLRKQRFGRSIGVQVDMFRFDHNFNQESLEKFLNDLATDNRYQGIVVQLPLPKEIDEEKILSLVPREKDIDVLSGSEIDIVSPVAGAAAEVLIRNNIDLVSKSVLVVGHGRLVGQPIVGWLRKIGVEPTIVDETVGDLKKFTKEADIIFSGAGQPSLITKDMVREGVVLIDAGTSSSEGVLLGDVDKECVDVASLMTPTPGGIGPITVAVLFKNLVELSI
jgi:methylenetetrahydrofolate dehydrogenase (NADP+)/methenyltetrahydrofolate cyclohydrolase